LKTSRSFIFLNALNAGNRKARLLNKPPQLAAYFIPNWTTPSGNAMPRKAATDDRDRRPLAHIALDRTNYVCTRLHHYETAHLLICMGATHTDSWVALRRPTSDYGGERYGGGCEWGGFGRGRRAKPLRLSLTKKFKKNGYALPNISFRSYARLGIPASLPGIRSRHPSRPWRRSKYRDCAASRHAFGSPAFGKNNCSPLILVSAMADWPLGDTNQSMNAWPNWRRCPSRSGALKYLGTWNYARKSHEQANCYRLASFFHVRFSHRWWCCGTSGGHRGTK